MQLGFFTMPIHPLGKDWRQCLREDRDAFILADRLGFTEGYVGEHATDQAENITSCALFIATLVEATKTIRLGTGTVNMPNSHPAAVASQIAMLDHLLDGRFNFGISPGGLLSDAEVFGNLDRDRTAMFVEAIDLVLAIWRSSPPYDLQGRFWHISTARTMIPGNRTGAVGEAAANAASANFRHRRRPAFQGARRRCGTRLVADLSQFSTAKMGCHPLAEVCRGVPQRRSNPRHVGLARSAQRVRGRRPTHSTRICPRTVESLSSLLLTDHHQNDA